MADTTANDIIERAMVKARVISPGESIPANKAAQMLEELNDLLEAWALERIMVIADVLENFALAAGTEEYTYGTGGDFDSARPIEIKGDCFIRSGDVDYPCRLKELSVYRRRSVKSTGGRPRILSYNPEYPLLKVLFWPTPSSTDNIYLRVSKTIASFALLTTIVNLMPGYRRALVSNLAIEISPNFGKKVPESLIFLADQSKRVIKSVNAIQVKPMTTPDLTAMTGNVRRGSILSGPWD